MGRRSTDHSVKSLLRCRTFWFNFIVLIVTAADFIPAKYSAPAAAIGNVILRLMTSQACTVFPVTKSK